MAEVQVQLGKRRFSVISMENFINENKSYKRSFRARRYIFMELYVGDTIQLFDVRYGLCLNDLQLLIATEFNNTAEDR